MKTHIISSEDGRHVVKVSEHEGGYTLRLYVNRGETATTTTRKAKTWFGVQVQAKLLLARVA